MFKKYVFKKNSIDRRRYSTRTTESCWQSVVGLEVHAQIKSISKLFSGASTKYASSINNNVSLFDCAIPGTLPVLNRRCVEAGVLTALALNCHVSPVSYFDRKHYFYADLPTGYQITQQRAPLAANGHLEFLVFTPKIHKIPYKTKVKLKQLQLEQDSGKSLHDEDRSLVDLNRAGVPLMELVFDPDLKDGEEAAALIKELIFILKRINTCSCKMEEGALRIDANVSVNRIGESFGVRTEIKNIGSVRAVAGAVKYEIKRQIKLKESGGTVVNETRAWDATKKVTVAMRDKEVMQDYRYMPEPNLPPLHIGMGLVERGCVNIDDLIKQIPELPGETRQRLQKENGLTIQQSFSIVHDLHLLQLFDGVNKTRKLDQNTLVNFILNDLVPVLAKKKIDLSKIEFNIDNFGEIVELFQNSMISRATAELLVEELMSGNNETPIKIVESRNLFQITDDKRLIELCEAAMAEQPKAVLDYKKGKIKALYAFMGPIAKNSNNNANMTRVAQLLKELLEK